MSRYEFDIDDFSVSVGYDVQLKTYFGYIERKDTDYGEPSVRIGEAARAYPDRDSFIRAFTESARGAGVEHITLPPKVCGKLKNDRYDSPVVMPFLSQS